MPSLHIFQINKLDATHLSSDSQAFLSGWKDNLDLKSTHGYRSFIVLTQSFLSFKSKLKITSNIEKQ